MSSRRMLATGEQATTTTGRMTTPFPKVSLHHPKKLIREIYAWLLENAALEAEARGNEFAAMQFRLNKANPSPADAESANDYLFGDDK